MKANLTTILLIAATAMIAVPTASANPCTYCRVSHSSGYCAPLCNRRLVQKTKYPLIPSWDEEDDEEAGGFSAEAGYEKDGYNAKIKWEQDQDQMDDEEAGGFSAEAGYEKDGYNAKIKWEQDQMDDEDVVRRLRAPRRLSYACATDRSNFLYSCTRANSYTANCYLKAAQMCPGASTCGSDRSDFLYSCTRGNSRNKSRCYLTASKMCPGARTCLSDKIDYMYHCKRENTRYDGNCDIVGNQMCR